MAAKYSDLAIDAMLNTPKRLPKDYVARTTLKDKRGHKERELVIAGQDGNQYRLILRQNDFNALDF